MQRPGTAAREIAAVPAVLALGSSRFPAQPWGGSRTSSITWTTPFEASTSGVSDLGAVDGDFFAFDPHFDVVALDGFDLLAVLEFGESTSPGDDVVGEDFGQFFLVWGSSRSSSVPPSASKASLVGAKTV